jgi:hypothetical protein
MMAAESAQAEGLREAQEEGLVRRWSEFTVCEELGAGGFGVVLRVERKNHSYAVKRPHPGLQHDASRLLELRGEFKMLKELYDDWLPQHPWDREDFTPIVKARARMPHAHGTPTPRRGAPRQLWRTRGTGAMRRGCALRRGAQLRASRGARVRRRLRAGPRAGAGTRVCCALPPGGLNTKTLNNERR